MASGSDSTLASPGMAPGFDLEACGNPFHAGELQYWGRNGKKILNRLRPEYPENKCDRTPSIARVKAFLEKRKDRDGQSILDKLGPEEPFPNGWWKLPVKDPVQLKGNDKTVAWHGTRFDRIYSILYTPASE